MDRFPPSLPTVPKTSGMAITSLVLGVSSFFCWIITGLPAVVLGIVSLLQINRSEGRLKGEGMAIAGMVTGGISTVMVFPIMLALLLPAVQAARTAARRNDSLATLRDFAIGLQNHHDTDGKFPAHASYSEDGKPLLSWRVLLLPYIEEVELYNQFHLDEPWDSEHNKQLIAKMPDIFQSASSPLNQADGKTLFLAPVGEGFVMDGTKDGIGIRQMPDGTTTTIVVVEADPDRAVIWTKPDDLIVDMNNPVAGLGGLYGGVFQAAFADGHARPIYNSIDPRILMALFTRNGREVFDSDDLNP